MAKPGDPQSSDHRPAAPLGSSPAHTSASASSSLAIPDPIDDDRVGFTSAASLAGVSRGSLVAASTTDAQDDEPEQTSLFDPPGYRRSSMPPPAVTSRPEPVPAPIDVTTEVGMSSAPPSRAEASVSEASFLSEALPLASAPPGSRVRRPSAATPSVFGRAAHDKATTVEPVEGAMGLYTVYALILFAIPTGGVAAVIALIAALIRPVPDQELARSHHEYQKRTLLIAAAVALAGGVMIVVNLGVFVLLAVALWLILRGTWGLMSLVHGKPIANPNQLWINGR